MIGAMGSLGGLIVALLANPFYSIFLPTILLSAKTRHELGIMEDQNLVRDKCLTICEAIAESYDSRIKIEMKKFLTEPIKTALFYCEKIDNLNETDIKQMGKLYARYKLNTILESEKNKNRIQYYSDFINKFSECVLSEDDEESLDYLKPVIEHLRTKIRK